MLGREADAGDGRPAEWTPGSPARAVTPAMLGAEDDLALRPARVLVAGTAGAGKSTLARRIAARLELPYFEIDALFHGPDWTPRAQFDDEVGAWADSPAWVTEWQYSAARARLADRAELLVWLDLPRWVVMRRLMVRTLARRRGAVELWNGNREPPLRTILTDREHIIRWGWRTHGEFPARIATCRTRRPGLPVVALNSAAEVEAWVEGPLWDCTATGAAGPAGTAGPLRGSANPVGPGDGRGRNI